MVKSLGGPYNNWDLIITIIAESLDIPNGIRSLRGDDASGVETMLSMGRREATINRREWSR